MEIIQNWLTKKDLMENAFHDNHWIINYSVLPPQATMAASNALLNVCIHKFDDKQAIKSYTYVLALHLRPAFGLCTHI